MIDFANKPYSANVQLTLHVNGQNYELAKVGADRIFLRKPVDLPPTEAELLISIDGEETRSRIHLPEGASMHSQAVPTSVVNG